MEEEKKDTEKAIIEAAKKVFTIHGLKGARMQAIADEAGINRAMLHYYFRSKEKIFDVVFSDALVEMNERMGTIAEADLSILEKITHFIEVYSEKASRNPEFDLFIMNEARQNPEYFRQLLKTSVTGKSMRSFVTALEQAAARGEIVGDPHQVFLSMLGVCIFPFAGLSLLRILMGKSEAEYAQLLHERRAYLTQSFVRCITP